MSSGAQHLVDDRAADALIEILKNRDGAPSSIFKVKVDRKGVEEEIWLSITHIESFQGAPGNEVRAVVVGL